MSRFAATCLALLFVVGFATVAWADDASIARGQKLFTEQKCSLCHSVGGVGNKKGALDDVATKLKAEEIRKWITSPNEMTAATKPTRKPAMKTFPKLTAQDVDALVAYLESLKAK